jgi:demethylmenaquinone methyltransferase/2-methoxy-6-polyprenyl-1,4-benzoquinol methylase
MAEYYTRRALEYERVYQKPERQSDLRILVDLLTPAFADQDVLEIACGTGYWTQYVAKSARSILATDFNPEVINIARQKDYGARRVMFLQSDAYSLANVRPHFTAGFHGFWWSHIPVQEIDTFLQAFHSKLSLIAKVVMIDNAYVEESSTPLCRKDTYGNTYQIRTLEDRSEHEVLKNFPSPSDLYARLKPFADDFALTRLKYYWIAQYRPKELLNQGLKPKRTPRASEY